MAKSFSAAIDDWTLKTKERTEAVFKESAQRITSIIQTPGPSVANPDGGAGGNMPIDTGFLRASLQGSLSGQTPSLSDNPGGSHSYAPGQINLVIANARIGDKITFAYGASYARKMEERYGFVRLGAQQWPGVVAGVVRDAKRRAGA